MAADPLWLLAHHGQLVAIPGAGAADVPKPFEWQRSRMLFRLLRCRSGPDRDGRLATGALISPKATGCRDLPHI